MKDDYRTGVMSVLACQLIWGFCPIYWQALEPIPSWIIILYRIDFGKSKWKSRHSRPDVSIFMKHMQMGSSPKISIYQIRKNLLN